MSLSQHQLDELCVNTLRILSAEAVQKANSGHPGLPLGAAAMAYVLWTKYLRFNPCNTRWPNRDRYVHSAGHGSALLYSLLHMTGCDLSLEDIKLFRQWQSKTPGHPEYDPELGVEATTGPLGQGFGMGVGMAIAERFLAAQFNRPGYAVMDHFTYAIVSDGDLMEGVASEAASLAGHLRLGKLIYLYDDNHICIEGDTALTFTEDVEQRFRAYGWQVLRVTDGNDIDAIDSAIRHAQSDRDRPSLIMVRNRIGYGSPKQDSASAHGEPLGEEALRITKETLNWPLEPSFHIPEEALIEFRLCVDRGKQLEKEWEDLFTAYAKAFPEEGEALRRYFRGELPDGWDADIPVFPPDPKGVATRVASGKVLNAIAGRVRNLLGGSADLAPSTKTLISGSPDQAAQTPGGRNLRYGVREHGMGAIVNGMALHGGVIPYGSTFLIFSDYLKPSLRVAALMGVHSLFVFTHDSIAVGEDGPTHQPVEQLVSMRAIPRFTVIRPADANETAEAWKVAVTRKTPIALILTRQNVPTLDRDRFAAAKELAKGAYILSDCQGDPDILLIASGSEVALAINAQERLASEKGIKARVISMPSWELFSEQSQEYKDSVLPPQIQTRLAIEAGSRYGWAEWTGSQGDIISVDRFGSSAPGGEVMKRYGFSVENVMERAEALIASTTK
ncbi:transketolase [Desulfomonile tiedjei]|uniref:Transketolase n=1 Tax=Desulfomonile tiedjei (strain ATCC 49306 / DSM 6799 / DCB-1) TaxID=706587 RepID=I4C8B0_DESTA|nr:transketolase [Desulfomonile tiedjei]AFM25801.1 transketolase [Desulfomonile tiedjei DSM 6799]